MARLNYIAPSPRKGKRYVAHFDDGAAIHFGDASYQNYTDHKDVIRKNRYIQRHINEAHLWESAPYTPAALSRWILWNKPDINDSIIDYRRRFDI
jgi:hypothetical protein